MAEYQDREHYIPLRRSDLIELLVNDKSMPANSRQPFRALCDLITAIFHFEYHRELEQLKNQYSPFDPDAVTAPSRHLTPEQREQELDRLLERFTWLMERANFKRLSREEIQAATEGASEWGINLDVDFDVFDRMEMFVRGDKMGKRHLRRWWKLWRLEEIKVPIYQRMVVILKQKKHKRLGSNPDDRSVFLKLFKDIPKMDLEMLLPGGKLQMPKLERGKLGASLLGAIGFVAYKLWVELYAIAEAFINFNPLAFWGPLALIFGYGYRQWAGFQTARMTYSLQLTQSLYYQNLDNNAGVLYHLLDEAEEQECREAVLAYHYLWRYAGDRGWTVGDLDDYVEMDLERLANLKVDFEIGDALAKLVRLKLVEKVDDRYRAIPLEKALAALDCQWDNYFQYNLPEKVAGS